MAKVKYFKLRGIRYKIKYIIHMKHGSPDGSDGSRPSGPEIHDFGISKCECTLAFRYVTWWHSFVTILSHDIRYIVTNFYSSFWLVFSSLVSDWFILFSSSFRAKRQNWYCSGVWTAKALCDRNRRTVSVKSIEAHRFNHSRQIAMAK